MLIGAEHFEENPKEDMYTFARRKISELLESNKIGKRLYTSGPENILKKRNPPSNEAKTTTLNQKRFNMVIKALYEKQKSPDGLATAYNGRTFEYRNLANKSRQQKEAGDWIEISPNEEDPLPPPPPQQDITLKMLIALVYLIYEKVQLLLERLKGADQAVIAGFLHHSVIRPLIPGTTLAKDENNGMEWKYYCDCEGKVAQVGVVSAKPHHFFHRVPEYNEFKKCVVGTVPARVHPSQIPLIKEAMKRGTVVLCVTKTTEKGYVELWTGQRDNCLIVGHVSELTQFDNNGMPFYQKHYGFLMHVDPDTDKIVKLIRNDNDTGQCPSFWKVCYIYLLI
jgi:hypothetical protein